MLPSVSRENWKTFQRLNNHQKDIIDKIPSWLMHFFKETLVTFRGMLSLFLLSKQLGHLIQLQV